MKAFDQSSIRKKNVLRILDLLTRQSPRTRYSLASATNLSLMTVSNLIDQLKEQRVLDLSPVPRSSGERPISGRKAENISLCGNGHAWLIIDLSGWHFRCVLLGFDLSILHEMRDTDEGEYVPRLTAFLTSVREAIELNLNGRTLLGVAVVAPGPYEISSDTICNQRLPELNSIHIKDLLFRCLGDYHYYVDEDVKFAVRAFVTPVEHETSELLYYLYIGEGVGGAAVHNGDMLRGLNATAGDAGQLTTPSGDTYESRLSLPSFAASLGCFAPDNKRLIQQLAQRAESDPHAYLQALEKAAETTASMLYSVLWILDPSRVIIDCRYTLSFQSEFIDAVSRSVAQRLSSSQKKVPLIIPAPQGMSSVTRGAVQILQREWIERILT